MLNTRAMKKFALGRGRCVRLQLTGGKGKKVGDRGSVLGFLRGLMILAPGKIAGTKEREENNLKKFLRGENFADLRSKVRKRSLLQRGLEHIPPDRRSLNSHHHCREDLSSEGGSEAGGESSRVLKSLVLELHLKKGRKSCFSWGGSCYDCLSG